MMQEVSLYKGVIETESGPISVRDLSYFLYHFRAVYVEALRYKENYPISGPPRENAIAQMAEEIAQSLSNKTRLDIQKMH